MKKRSLPGALETLLCAPERKTHVFRSPRGAGRDTMCDVVRGPTGREAYFCTGEAVINLAHRFVRYHALSSPPTPTSCTHPAMSAVELQVQKPVQAQPMMASKMRAHCAAVASAA